jgi:hypothetical protein
MTSATLMISEIDAGKPQRQRRHQICEGIHAGILGTVLPAPTDIPGSAPISEPAAPNSGAPQVGLDLRAGRT